jgi:S1-C subfamily serine protease
MVSVTELTPIAVSCVCHSLIGPALARFSIFLGPSRWPLRMSRRDSMALVVRGGRGSLTVGLAAALLGSGSLAGCGGTVISSRTPEAAGMSLSRKGPDCDVPVLRGVGHLARYTVVASLVYEDIGGMLSAGSATADRELKAEACRLGAEAVVIQEEHYKVPFIGTRVVASGVVRRPGGFAGEDGPARPPAAGDTSLGTCFAVRADGVVLTAHHVLKGARRLRVQFPSGRTAPAKLLAGSADADVAVLATEVPTPQFLRVVSSSAVQPGDRVFTFGFPVRELLGDEPKFTEGAISSLSGLRGERRLMQVTIPIQPGNSGGPVVTETGTVVGMLTSTAAAATFFRATGALPQGINWAVKSDLAIPLYDPPSRSAAPAADRAAAISLARAAACAVVAEY